MGKKGQIILAGVAAFGIVYYLRKQAGAGTLPHGVEALIADPIYFEYDSQRIDAEGQERLKSLVALLGPLRWSKLIVVGHTDAMGGGSYNYELGMRRSAAAKAYLEQQGLSVPPGGSVHTRSAGSTRPTADNTTAGGRALNRRVEIEIEP